MKKNLTVKIVAAISVLLLLLSAISISIIALGSNIGANSGANAKNLSRDVYGPSTIAMDSRKTVYQPLLIEPYKSVDVFLSPEHESDFGFTAVGGTWKEVAPPSTAVVTEIRFKENDKWSNWLHLDAEIESIDGDEITRYTTASTNEADAMQYRFIMYGDGEKTPLIKDSKWTFIKTNKDVALKSAPVPQYGSSYNQSNITYLALKANAAGIITRDKWGADEFYRYMDNNDEEPELVSLGDDFYEKYADELKLSRVVEKDSEGDRYKWPLQYPQKVKKIIIHHTATTSDLKDPEQAIRDIYYYHAISRGWGDIGYNYLIDTEGNVYEGRYGGEGVIGAHAGPGNNGSIGIAVLGDYEHNDVPEAVIESLTKLVQQKAKIHNIKTDGYSMFRDELMPNVFGHKDIMATSCPGANLYAKLPVIRTMAAQDVEIKKKFVKDYDFQDLSEIYYVELDPGETREFEIELENIGKKSWNDDTFIVVNRNPEFDGVISFPDKEGVALAKLEEKSVKSGDKGTFKFEIKGGKKGQTVFMKIAPVINGTKKISDYIVVPVSVHQSEFTYKFVSKNFPDEAIQPGAKFDGWVKIKNTGNATWNRTGESSVVLAADHVQGRDSEFVRPAGSLLARMEEDEVEPGETAKFIFEMQAPKTPGYYKEYFTPVVDWDLWMQDTGMYFDVLVSNGQSYSAELLSASTPRILKKNRENKLWANIQNTGEVTWKADNFKGHVIKDPSLDIQRIRLLNKELKPGEVGRIEIIVDVDEAAEEGLQKPLLVKPQVDGEYILNQPIYLYYSVESADKRKVETSQEESVEDDDNQPDIRVKLSFDGNPEISGSGSYKIYSGDELLGEYGRNETAKVTESKGKYRVKVGKKSFLRNKPIRFEPVGKTILEIENYDHAPGWNPSLNDNQYRGILEVREDGRELIVINELPVEDYLKGLGEVSNNENYEKIKTIIVAARSYALFYLTEDEKFPGKPYHLDDDPEKCQKYLGYGMEKRSPNVKKAVEKTQGEVVAYGGKVVKAPYFNQSDGTYTKTPKEVWGWDAPYLKPVNDSYCKGTEFLGHGVGLSGCGAKALAEQGKNYEEILKYYYTGITIEDLY